MDTLKLIITILQLLCGLAIIVVGSVPVWQECRLVRQYWRCGRLLLGQKQG